MIGGIGYVGGAVVATFMVPAGFIALYTKNVENLDRYLIMASGFIVIATLIQHPHGVADTVSRAAERLAAERRAAAADRRRAGHADRPVAERGGGTRSPADLVVTGMTVGVRSGGRGRRRSTWRCGPDGSSG